MVKFKYYDTWSTYNSDSSNVVSDDICFITGAGVIRTKSTSFVCPTTFGTAGQVLTSNGSNSKPTWEDAAGGAGVEEITYSNLVTLRNNSGLIPGQWYRITDYQTTTVQENTQSAGHQFDVIVRADDVNVLNENAYAALHDGDTYFSTAGAKLEAWELKYCLDNDTTRFAWADSTNGKGVIYWMKDENDNECPYDFKNIQFKWTSAISQSGIVANVYYYTFSVATGTNDATVTDHSLNGDYCYGNEIGVYVTSNKQSLNSNVFRNTVASSPCYSNTFGDSCYSNTFGEGSYNNTLGNRNYNNTFGEYCTNNTFQTSCSNNTLGGRCSYNTFGGYNHNIKFGTSDTVKSYCRFITIETGNRNIYLHCSATTSSSKYFQNVKIAQGVNNTTTYKTITHATAGDTFQTIYKPTNSVEVSV